MDFGSFVSKYWDEAADFLAERKTLNHDYFAPSEEPLEWKTKGRAVRMDVVIMAIHLLCARYAFRGVPGLLQQAARIGANKAKGFAISYALKTAEAGARATKVVNQIGNLADVLDKTTVERAKEGKIRIETIKILRDLYKNNLLPQRSRGRRVQLVASRHKTKVQRKPNKSWIRRNSRNST